MSIKFTNEVTGAHNGQIDCEAGIWDNLLDILGVANYTLYQGELTLKHIFVLPIYRRMGYGAKLMRYIIKENPDYIYKPSWKTDMGSKFNWKVNENEDIIYSQIQKLIQPVEDLIKEKRYIPLRKMFSEINKNNFHISTKADFKKTNKDWDSLKTNKDRTYKSKTGSKYIIKDDILYRHSNHWGGIASCLWTLNGEGDPDYRRRGSDEPFQIGYAYYKDFEPYSVYFKRDRVLDPLWMEKIVKPLQETRNAILKIKDSEYTPNEMKHFLGKFTSKYRWMLQEIDRNVKKIEQYAS